MNYIRETLMMIHERMKNTANIWIFICSFINYSHRKLLLLKFSNRKYNFQISKENFSLKNAIVISYNQTELSLTRLVVHPSRNEFIKIAFSPSHQRQFMEMVQNKIIPLYDQQEPFFLTHLFINLLKKKINKFNFSSQHPNETTNKT